MPTAYEIIAQSYIASDEEVKRLFAPPPPPRIETPFADYFQKKVGEPEAVVSGRATASMFPPIEPVEVGTEEDTARALAIKAGKSHYWWEPERAWKPVEEPKEKLLTRMPFQPTWEEREEKAEGRAIKGYYVNPFTEAKTLLYEEPRGMERISQPLYTPIGEGGVAPADILGLVGMVGALGYGTYQAATIGWNAFLRASLSRNLNSWSKAQNIEIPKDVKANFLNQAMAQLDKKWLSKQAISTIFKPVKGQLRISPDVAREAAEDVANTTNRVITALIPRATQTGAMAYGGKAVPPPGGLPPIVPPKLPVAEGIPTEPPVPPTVEEGKLFLPEPPRTTEFMEFARKELKGSFRQKIGALDTVEQAHQQVLKARDMGENVVPYIMSYVHRTGDVIKEFGVDASGLATNVENPQNLSLAINDVLSNYTHYDLTPAQVKIAKEQGFIYQEALKLAKSYGVKISEIGKPDEFWQYIARKVTAKRDPTTGLMETPPPTIGGFKMGAKISSQKERIFDEMSEGVDLGFLYENPDQVMASHIRGIYRLIGNKQAEDTVMQLTREITKATPLQFGERALTQPALQARASNVEIANAIDKVFKAEESIPALRIGAEISGAIVGQIAALDVSAPFIQGLPLLGHDIKMGLTGKPSTLWARSYGKMWKSVFNMDAISSYRNANPDLYKRAIEAGVLTGQSEFVSGVPVTEKALGKIPLVGNTLREAYRQSWGRLGGAYSDFLEISRIKYFEQMESVWLKNGGNIYDLGALSNRMLGSVSSKARGISINRSYGERIAAFAPNYLRSMFLLLGDMVKGGMKAKEVWASLAALLGAGAAFYYAEEKLRGREPKMKPWPKRLGGDGAEAFTMEIAGQRVGLGSWIYGLIKMVAEVGAIAVDDPGSLVIWDSRHPVARFAKSKMGAGVSLVVALATGRNFYGRKFENAGDYLLRILESLTPISAQPLVEKADLGRQKEPTGILTALGAQVLGMRAFPYTLRSQWSDEGVFKDFDEIPSNEIERKSKLKDAKTPQERAVYALSRSKYRTKYPDVEAKLFITGQVFTISTNNALFATLKLIQEYNINPDEISGIKRNKEERVKREELGVPDTTITFTDRLVNKLGGKALPSGETSPYPVESLLPVSSITKIPSTGITGEPQTWDNIKKDLGSSLLKALNRLWYENGSLTPDEITKLQQIHRSYPLGYSDFNEWVRSGLKQFRESNIGK